TLHVGAVPKQNGRMGNYWRKMFVQAWTDTKQSFGWNQKTAATVLGALALVVVAFLHFGLAAMLTSAIGLFWTALPIAIAGLSLFIGIFFPCRRRATRR